MVTQLKEAIELMNSGSSDGMRKKKNALGYTYLAPALISILLVTCLPIIYTVILSFTNYNMYHLTDYTFVGLENYLTVFSGSIKNVFFPVLGWTICFALLSTAGSYAMGLILAILLNNPHMKESKIYRAVLIVPWALHLRLQSSHGRDC